MFQTMGTTKELRKVFVLASPERKRTCFRRKHITVGTKVTMDFNDKLHTGVVAEIGAEGRTVVSYDRRPGQAQEYEGGELQRYAVRGSR
jgi:hypothetical protein